MVTIQRMVIHTLIIIINIVLNDANRQETALGLLSKLLGKQSRSPLVVILDAKSMYPNYLRSNQDKIDTNQGVKPIGDLVDDKNAAYWLKEVLRSTGDKKDPTVQKTNDKFKSALRSRCTSYYECTITCTKKKKPKKSCIKSCQDVFDYLMMCNPPGGKKSKPKPKPVDSCESNSCQESNECNQYMNCKAVFSNNQYGKTMPPRWRL